MHWTFCHPAADSCWDATYMHVFDSVANRLLVSWLLLCCRIGGSPLEDMHSMMLMGANPHRQQQYVTDGRRQTEVTSVGRCCNCLQCYMPVVLKWVPLGSLREEFLIPGKKFVSEKNWGGKVLDQKTSFKPWNDWLVTIVTFLLLNHDYCFLELV